MDGNTTQSLRQFWEADGTKQPPPPYVKDVEVSSAPYLTLHVHTTSSSGSIVFRTDTTPRVLYEVYNPSIPRHFQRLRSEKPNMQIISMKRNLVVCNVRFPRRHDKHPHSTFLTFPVTGQTITYSSDTLKSQHGNGSADNSLIWSLEQSVHPNADTVKICRDSDGVVVCQAIMNPSRKTARIDIARPCSSDEGLDELVTYALVQIDVYCSEYRKIDRLLTESGF